jgi:hypothetical protein
MTSVLNAKENVVEIEEPLTELEGIDLTQELTQPCVNYAEVILGHSRLEHLSEENIIS